MSSSVDPSAPPKNKKTELAILAAGCFWGVEHIFRDIPGVIDTTVGYTGGTKKFPTYEEVCTGKTGHAEAIEIEFDPQLVSYEDLLKVFFRMHDPTTLNRQHNDIGPQYRSAIFYESEIQKSAAQTLIATLNRNGTFPKPVVTEVTEVSTFYPAEKEHQDYLKANPGGYNCHILRPS